ncbi:uncharacterized protein K441DRAFT_581845, partial [Cenococcum geophilum 1.58]|uniref:uncharacterized protein n=1 Tax=Cenococcum geophilum 1.58 TaxID=794803 RepID=UPI00358F9154
TFNKAVISRIYYRIKYRPLGVNTRREIWQRFLVKASTKKGDAKYNLNNLKDFIKYKLNK